MANGDFGVCGRANRPCKIAHSSTYPNRVGIYPSEFLPSTFTIWHATFASNFPPQTSVTQFFTPIGGLLIPNLGLGPGPLIHTWQSHHYVIFARTANRFNVAYTLTEADIENADDLGESEIDVGEYIFEVVSVTDEQIVIDNGLSDQEVEGLEDVSECNEQCSFESQDDREFRKLFEMPLKNEAGKTLEPLFVSIVPNILGTEYRMDNGTRKSKLGLDQAGLGDLDNPSNQDGTSRLMRVKVKTFDEEGAETDASLEAGDVIYLTYVAVKEHYIRQRINISWQTIDTGTVSECISLFLGFSVVHFRFYEWDMEPDDNGTPRKLVGWRAVEAFSSDINFVAPMTVNNQTELADFVMGAPDVGGTRSVEHIPGKTTIAELEAFREARNTEPTYPITLDGFTQDNIAFHTNVGAEGNNTAFRNSDWFQRNQFSKYRNQINASNHVFFNVHPKALRKRDIDKFGIERFLAVELEKDINTGKLTFFPFMDDPDVDNPSLGANESMKSSNTLFEPIQPVTSYGGNFDAFCNSLGTFPTNPADGINTYHSFESNKINERFDEGTRVLVEKNFAVGPSATQFGTLGPRLITIEGAGGTRGSVTCLADPSREFAFAGHTNDDGFLVYNSFSNGHAEDAIRSLVFRPDIASPPFKENATPTVDQFEKLVGFSGMIGDIPGIQPGRAVSITSAARINSFTYKTTDQSKLQDESPFILEEQIEEINLPDANISPLIIPASNSYYGSLKIEYELRDGAEDKDNEALLLAKTGSDISGIVDGLIIRNKREGSNTEFLQVDFRWLRAASFELVGPRVEDMTVRRITMRSIKTDQLNDFLNEQDSHTADFAQSSLDDRLTDRSLFFGTDIVTMSEDERSNLYTFFNDTDGGISAVSSNDFGDTWAYYYGIVEKIENIEPINPFAVTNYPGNSCYLFFQFGGKILCKKIQFNLFEQRDANLIERFSADILEAGNNEQLPVEKPSIYSRAGQILRRGVLSYVAAGDLTDEVFREITGKVPGEFEYSPLERRRIEDETITVRKNPIAIAPATAFTNANINDSLFSAYRKDNGELRLWFMGDTQNSDSQLQCHFSIDDGQSWYDLWEFLEFGYNRLRFDSEKKTQFIDRSANVDVPTTLEATDPEEGGQEAPFGINIHWSRLKRHKIIPSGKKEGDLVIEDESQTLEISSPYVFYQSMTDRVFLFYVYEGCLLCKVFNDEIFSDAAKARVDNAPSESSGITAVKTIIERQTRSHFIDGSLASATLREELHRFPNEENKEIMAEGNIIFKYPFAVDNFVDNRSIGNQRVCAYSLPTGLVRVFYKHSDSINLKSALWTGSEWWAEDFLRDPQNVTELDLPDNSEFTEVIGGFGGTGFTP